MIMNLSELLSSMPDSMKRQLRDSISEELGDTAGPKPLLEGVVANLLDAFECFDRGNPFKPGDLVTARPGTPIRWAGSPAIVLEVFEKPIRMLNAEANEASSSAFGQRLDMRVLQYIPEDGQYRGFVVESWLYQRLPDLETTEPVAAPAERASSSSPWGDSH